MSHRPTSNRNSSNNKATKAPANPMVPLMVLCFTFAILAYVNNSAIAQMIHKDKSSSTANIEELSVNLTHKLLDAGATSGEWPKVSPDSADTILAKISNSKASSTSPMLSITRTSVLPPNSFGLTPVIVNFKVAPRKGTNHANVGSGNIYYEMASNAKDKRYSVSTVRLTLTASNWSEQELKAFL